MVLTNPGDFLSTYSGKESNRSTAAGQASVQAALAAPLKDPGPGYKSYAEQFLILVTCRDEKHQGELLTRCRAEGWECKAVVG